MYYNISVHIIKLTCTMYTLETIRHREFSRKKIFLDGLLKLDICVQFEIQLDYYIYVKKI